MPAKILDTDKSLKPYKLGICEIFDMARGVFSVGGKLFVCGNGGSFADALHIGGELMKSFERKRPLASAERKRFSGLYGAAVLVANLERGLPVIPLGANPSLTTALLNDCKEKEILFAQELFVLGSERDMLLAISTSGNARDALLAVSVARAKGMRTAALTGKDGGLLKDAVEIAVIARQNTTRAVQEAHQVIYHALCRMLEEYFFRA